MQLDWPLIATVAACTGSYIAVAIPTGRLVERHTGERLIKWLWRGVLGMFAIGAFVSFYGVGEAVTAAGRHAAEQQRSAPADQDPPPAE